MIPIKRLLEINNQNIITEVAVFDNGFFYLRYDYNIVPFFYPDGTLIPNTDKKIFNDNSIDYADFENNTIRYCKHSDGWGCTYYNWRYMDARGNNLDEYSRCGDSEGIHITSDLPKIPLYTDLPKSRIISDNSLISKRDDFNKSISLNGLYSSTSIYNGLLHFKNNSRFFQIPVAKNLIDIRKNELMNINSKLSEKEHLYLIKYTDIMQHIDFNSFQEKFDLKTYQKIKNKLDKSYFIKEKTK